MSTPLLELEGTLEEIKAQLPDFGEQRFHITITPVEKAAMNGEQAPSRKLSITEKILARAAQTPPEERVKIPSDLTDNLDHYIYGWPKK